RLLDRLYLTDPAPLWGDLMERSIHNGLFGAQSPDGRKIRYYTPYEVPRVYFDRDTYCCPCNYRRIMGELPNMVYYQTKKGVLANLYTPSEATIELKDGKKVRLRQSTDYPTSGRIEFEVGLDQPETFEFAFRIPRWCEDASLIINGEESPSGQVKSGTIHRLERTWRDGDRIRLQLAMKPRWVKGRQSQAGRVALMMGPRVFGVDRTGSELDPDLDLRLVTIDPESLEGPFEDNSLREGGVAFTVEAWKPGEFYPMAKKGLTLRFVEYPNPEVEMVYFKIPNPEDDGLVEDELAVVEKMTDL
ncbi:MAG: glycoside hydrolase family 127 protein, partial [Candidatus Omnitrophica bacterium]|nr:glycoside hydrolase family 127 protein [Candidatus Omnitrophota bacterium]